MDIDKDETMLIIRTDSLFDKFRIILWSSIMILMLSHGLYFLKHLEQQEPQPLLYKEAYRVIIEPWLKE